MFRKIHFLEVCHLGKFDDLMQSVFWVISKITFANLCKTIQDAIIIPVLFDPLILETAERKGQITKN